MLHYTYTYSRTQPHSFAHKHKIIIQKVNIYFSDYRKVESKQNKHFSYYGQTILPFITGFLYLCKNTYLRNLLYECFLDECYVCLQR